MTYLLSLSLLGLLCSSSDPQQDMVCRTTKPRDTRNHEVHFVHKDGDYTTKWCTTKAHSSSPHSTASAAAPQAFRSSAPTTTLRAGNTPCEFDPLPVLPGYGYNILTGMPLSDGKNAVDPGYLNSPVFDPALDHKYANLQCIPTGKHSDTGYKTWSRPGQYTVTLLNSMTEGSQMKSIHDEHTFQKEAKSSLDVSGGYKGYGADVSFTAGASWKSSTSKFEDGETVEQRYQREAWAFRSTLVPAEVPLSSGYLQTLCAAYLSNDWTVFFMSYGTHVTTDVTCGARYSQVTLFKRKKFEEIRSNEQAYNAGIKASYAGATGSVNATNENSKKARDMVESASTDQYIVSVGGDATALDGANNANEYQKAAHNFPAPLSSALLAHDILIVQSKWDDFQQALAHYHANDPNAKDVTPDLFKQKWVAALEAYCANDAHKCKAATSIGAPAPMVLTPVHFQSQVFGTNGNWDGKRVVTFDSALKDVLKMDPSVSISKINTFCGTAVHGRRRLRGIQFSYFDGTHHQTSDVLGEKGNSDRDSGGAPWDDQENIINFGEFISSVEVSAGDNIDGIWFHVQKLKDATTRKIGCGWPTDNQRAFNVHGDQKLLAMQGTSFKMERDTVVTEIQFRTYLTLFPNFKDDGAVNCNCALTNVAEGGKNGAYCSDGEFLWCDNSQQACTTPTGVSFPKTGFLNQCVNVCLNGPIVTDRFGVAPCLCEGKVRTDGVCLGNGNVWRTYQPGCGCSNFDLMCRRRCDDYEESIKPPAPPADCMTGPVCNDRFGVSPCVCEGSVRSEGVCYVSSAGSAWKPYQPGCGCSNMDLMCRRRCDDYEATVSKPNLLRSAVSPTPTHEELLQMLETKSASRSARLGRNEEAGSEPYNNPPARSFKSAGFLRNEEAGSEPYNNPPARSLKSARFVRSEEAGSEPYNNPPARSLKSAGFVRSEEPGSEPYNNPPARSLKSSGFVRSEEAGSEPYNNPPARSLKSARFVRSEEAGSEPYNNPPARSLKSTGFVRSEEAGSEPYNNPPARSLKSAGFVRSEEPGSEPYNNPPARSVRLGRNEEPGSEPHSRSSRFLRSEEAGSEPYSNPPARSLKSAGFLRNEEPGSEPYSNPPARSLRSTSEEAGSEPKPKMFQSAGSAPTATKDSTHHHSTWEETKRSVNHMVKDMSKELKEKMKAELKELLAKELKTAVANLQHKQIQLEATITRMLLNEIENY